MRIRNERGIALAVTLLVIVVLIVFGAVFVMRTVTEKNLSDRQRMSVKAFYIAEAGEHIGLDSLNTIINTHMLNTVNTTNPNVLANRAQTAVGNGDGIGFLIQHAANGGAAQFTLVGTQAESNVSATSFGSGNYSYKISVTEKSDPTREATDTWKFPYYYRVESTGTSSGESKKVVVSGDFTVEVQRDNFAKYALFTDHHTMPSGSTVWFTDKTNFAGPLHTNERYAFARNPSGTFDGAVTQQNLQARFYNNGSSILSNSNSNGTIDVPTFNSTYTRSAAQIVLASSVQKQDLIDQARGGDTTTGNGIFVANNGTALTGGIYVSGNSNVTLAVDSNGDAKYTILQGSTTKNITVKKTQNQTVVETVGVGSTTYTGLPDGVDDLGTIIYVNGTVSSLAGTVQRDTEVTISSENDIVLSNHVVYQEYNAAVGTPGTVGYVPPNADDKTNLLGLVAWGGNVRIGTSAPNNVNVHSIVMARNGIFTVNNYTSTSVGSRGVATLLGGSITQFYGAFGLFNGSSGAQVAGYGRNFVYDSRTLLGKSPPYFPSMNTFVAFTNDLTDKLIWQEEGS